MSSKNLIQSFRNAGKGFMEMLRSERNAQIHFVITFLVIIAGVWLRVSPAEWLFLFLSIGFVLAAEAFNTAIERLTDLIHPDFHKDAGAVKDVAAAGVMIAAMVAMAIGFIIFLPHFIEILKRFDIFT